MKSLTRQVLTAAILLGAILNTAAQDKKAMTVQDVMKFRQIKDPILSTDGNWVVHTSAPDRGDPDVYIHSADGKKEYIIPQGENPLLSNDGKWVAARTVVPAELVLNNKTGKGRMGPQAGLCYLNTLTGELSTYKNVRSFAFSNDSRWLVYLSYKVEDEPAAKDEGEEGSENPAGAAPAGGVVNGPDLNNSSGKEGSDLYIISMDNESYEVIPFVLDYTIDSSSSYMAVTVADTGMAGNGLYIVDFHADITTPLKVFGDSNAWADDMTWNNTTGQLAFLGGIGDSKLKRTDAEILLWAPGDSEAVVIVSDEELEKGEPALPEEREQGLAHGEVDSEILPVDWRVYSKNSLRFSRDGKRLFMGLKPASQYPDEVVKDTTSKVYDTDAILADRKLDVWHWNDLYINSNQKKMWNREKDRTYAAVYHLDEEKLVLLADEEVPDIRITDCSGNLLAASNLPYAQRITWEGRFNDYYLVDVNTGKRTLALKKMEHPVSLSPDGKFLVYYEEGDWYLMETATMKSRNLTKGTGVPFTDEDWDYPGDVPGYGVAGWVDGSKSVMIYDKYDIWQFAVMNGEPVCLTEGFGRSHTLGFRIVRLDGTSGSGSPHVSGSSRGSQGSPGGRGRSGSGRTGFITGESQFLSAYHDLEKYTAIYTLRIGTKGVSKVVEDPCRYTLIARSELKDRILFSRQTYTEYPDLWVADPVFRKPRKLTDADPQMKDLAWGEAELVEWTSMDGIPLQGVLIKPGNYKPGMRYPVLVYYYRFFSDRLYEFNEVVINHRPCFPFYASNGYAVFLPDIRFDVGSPGYSATKCLVPGVQKIIDMGVADPDAICLHGHSWSGYQTAFVITRTDIFACAIAGAPVSNMTSAYSGIRWGTGLSRQFQYEKSQSRIGGSLWEARDKYIENSPVFFADRINTPLLIEFGDQDDAVPWYQGIELYLAMRRLQKECVFLQYRGEPHHLKQYGNKLDYTLKFKAWLDHYLKGEPAPEWIEKGVPYNGK